MSITAPDDLQIAIESHRRELTGYCYRMLGSGFEAEDAVQETMVRAWKASDRLESRAALKSWLYRIATNVCLDMLQGAQRRARPIDLSSPDTADAPLRAPLHESAWLQPVADAAVLSEDDDPATIAAARETLRLAFVAALQHLPPKQRAVLILCEVLRWKASEAAALLETSVASVNSALQRARATLDGLELEDTGPAVTGEDHQDLLDKYVDAFERYDMDLLVSLLHEDAMFSMPPYDMWFRGPGDIVRFMTGPGAGCENSRVVPLRANGCPAAAIYKPDPDGEGYIGWNVAVLEVVDGRIAAITHFLEVEEVFPQFGLPSRLES